MQGEKRFIDSNFANADLRQADLSNMIMLTTNMEGADLRGANLSHTFFTRHCNFRDADLRGANLNHVWFTDADQRAVKNGNRKRTAEAVNVPPTFCLYLKAPPTKKPPLL